MRGIGFKIYHLKFQQDSEIDPEVAELINTANMEMLATLVLNGEGSRLVGRQSENVELQAFLDNVPTYMVSGKQIVTQNNKNCITCNT